MGDWGAAPSANATKLARDEHGKKERAPRSPRLACVRAPSAEAVRAVEAIYAELPVRRPRDIDVLSIAAAHGVYGRVDDLVRGEGQLVQCGGVGLAVIDRRAAEEGLFAFNLAHELGHGKLDGAVVDLASCRIQKSDGQHRMRETRVNDFAAELTMPGFLFGPLLERLGGEAGETIDHVFEAADAFRMPDDAVALRMLLFTRLACAAVVSEGGRVKWWACTRGFSTLIPWGARVGERTLAAKLHGGGRIDRRGQTIARGVWGRSDDSRPIAEQAVRLAGGRVLTWLVERA